MNVGLTCLNNCLCKQLLRTLFKFTIWKDFRDGFLGRSDNPAVKVLSEDIVF